MSCSPAIRRPPPATRLPNSHNRYQNPLWSQLPHLLIARHQLSIRLSLEIRTANHLTIIVRLVSSCHSWDCHGHLVTLFVILFFMMLDLHYYRDAIISFTSFTEQTSFDEDLSTVR